MPMNAAGAASMPPGATCSVPFSWPARYSSVKRRRASGKCGAKSEISIPSKRARLTMSWCSHRGPGSGFSRLYCEICPHTTTRAWTFRSGITASVKPPPTLSKYTSMPAGANSRNLAVTSGVVL